MGLLKKIKIIEWDYMTLMHEKGMYCPQYWSKGHQCESESRVLKIDSCRNNNWKSWMTINNQLFSCQLLEVHTSVVDGHECVVQRIIRLSSTSSWTYRPNPKHIDSKKMLFSLRKKNLSITSPLNRTSFLIFQKNLKP
jgi:hypothetical protein